MTATRWLDRSTIRGQHAAVQLQVQQHITYTLSHERKKGSACHQVLRLADGTGFESITPYSRAVAVDSAQWTWRCATLDLVHWRAARVDGAPEVVTD